ncbi:DUF4190 domain-containing protein [Metallibacterium scheffleri]
MNDPNQQGTNAMNDPNQQVPPPAYPPQPQGYPPQGYYQQPMSMQQVPSSTSGLAIVSLVLALIGLPGIAVAGFGFLLLILAIVFGHVARGKIRRAQPPGSIGGDGMALAGLIIGYIFLVLGLIIIFIVGNAMYGVTWF